jgi:glutathione S-transferase
MPILHHLNHSRSQRILWLFAELGLDYDIQTHFRDPKTGLAPDSLKAIFDLGRSPVVTLDDAARTTLGESGAIVEYFAQTHPDGHLTVKSHEPLFAQYLYWLHFAEGTMMPPLIANLVLGKAKSKKKPFLVKAIADKVIDAILHAYYSPNNDQNVAHVEKHLAQQVQQGFDFMVGDRLTTADIMMLFPLEAMVASQPNSMPTQIAAYVNRMQQRPAYQQALQAGGEYNFGPKSAA